jgi:hypothetical protein
VLRKRIGGDTQTVTFRQVLCSRAGPEAASNG